MRGFRTAGSTDLGKIAGTSRTEDLMRNWEQLAPKATGRDAITEVGKSVEHENPHAEEMQLHGSA
jgi:hypothetical protein